MTDRSGSPDGADFAPGLYALTGADELAPHHGAATSSPSGQISTITGTITNSVTAGAGNYAPYLTITDTGTVTPSTGGGDALILGQAYQGFNGDQVFNHGTLIGGAASSTYAAGDGAFLFDGTLANSGTITGGQGGAGYGPGGQGAAGLYQQQGSASNSGTIAGGAGGSSTYGQRGAGGDGLKLRNGVLTNTGTILAGAGGIASVGVYLTNATLLDQGGLIAGYDGGDAVKFGFSPATLELYAGAHFMGQVAAYGFASDTLDLAGPTAGTLSGLGTEYTGFSTLDFATGSHWTVSGTYTAFSSGIAIDNFTASDTLVLQGFLATSATYVAGQGLELGNGTTTITLDIGAAPPGDHFTQTDNNGNTTLSLTAGQVSVIATDLTHPVIAGAGNYAPSLTITSTGAITPPE